MIQPGQCPSSLCSAKTCAKPSAVAAEFDLERAVQAHVIGPFARQSVTYDGAEMVIYQNGLAVGQTPKTGSLITNPNVAAWIGANPVGGRVFDGTIDNVRIYSRALSPPEVVADLTTPVGQ